MANNFKTDDLVKGLKSAIKAAQTFLKLSEKTSKEIEEMAKAASKFSDNLDTGEAKGLKAFNSELEKTNKLVKLKTENDKAAKQAELDLIKSEKELIKALSEEEKLNQQRIKTKNIIRAQEIKEVKEKERLITVQKKIDKQNAESIAKAKKLNK